MILVVQHCNRSSRRDACCGAEARPPPRSTLSLQDAVAIIEEHHRALVSLHPTNMTEMKRPEDMPGAFQAAWNAHDMAALGTLFEEEATFVNRFGHYVRGIDAIVAMHEPIHQTIYRDSSLKNELIDVAHLAEGVAVVHCWSRLTAGVAHPAGPHDVDTLILAVLTRRDDAWRIRALENVTLSNPRTGEVVLRG